MRRGQGSDEGRQKSRRPFWRNGFRMRVRVKGSGEGNASTSRAKVAVDQPRRRRARFSVCCGLCGQKPDLNPRRGEARKVAGLLVSGRMTAPPRSLEHVDIVYLPCK